MKIWGARLALRLTDWGGVKQGAAGDRAAIVKNENLGCKARLATYSSQLINFKKERHSIDAPLYFRYIVQQKQIIE
jgi:hypothetical protein